MCKVMTQVITLSTSQNTVMTQVITLRKIQHAQTPADVTQNKMKIFSAEHDHVELTCGTLPVKCHCSN